MPMAEMTGLGYAELGVEVMLLERAACLRLGVRETGLRLDEDDLRCIERPCMARDEAPRLSRLSVRIGPWGRDAAVSMDNEVARDRWSSRAAWRAGMSAGDGWTAMTAASGGVGANVCDVKWR